MDENNNNNPQRELTEEEKLNPVSSGAVEWHDPLDKPKFEDDRPTGKLALISVILGIAGICMACALPAGTLLGTAGLICGIVSRVRHENAKKLRTAGIVLSAVALIIVLLMLVLGKVLDNGGVNINDYYQSFESSVGI